MLSNISSLYGNVSSLYGALSALGSGSLSSGSSVTTLNQQASSYQVKLSAYGRLQSSLDTFKTAVTELGGAQKAAPFKATSSTTKTLSATADGDAAAGTHDVTVSQMAKTQTLTSTTYADANATLVGTGTLTIQTGAYNSSTNTFTAKSGTSATSISISSADGTLNGLAKAINASDAGVTASVVRASGGGYQLSIASKNSGTENTVRITAAEDNATNGSNGDLSGLSALAFDPTAGPVGYGKNLTETVVAQDAQLTVDGSSVTSQSNAVTAAIKGVTLNLSAVGTTTVDVARDADAFQTSAQKLVDAYNTLQKTSASLSTYSAGNVSPPLANDSISARIGSDLRNVLTQATSGVGSSKLTLTDIGITRQADGTLALNQATLQSAFASNTEGAAALLGETADKLASTVTRDTSASSALRYATQSASRALQSVENRKSLLQDYTANTYFGLPPQPPLSDYISVSNRTAQAGRYSQISSLS